MATRKNANRELKRYWLSYDLGLRGSYDSLYEWLDDKAAKECGDSLATFRSNMTTEEIRRELLDVLGEGSKARIYLCSQSGGSFLLGKRKAAPWAGYSQVTTENAMDQ
jgi:hypothetical protein